MRPAGAARCAGAAPARFPDGRCAAATNYPEIGIYRYLTEGFFDGYSWQTVARRTGFITQVMRGVADVCDLADVEAAALSHHEVKLSRPATRC